VKNVGDEPFIPELLNDVIVFVASAASAMGQPVNMDRRRVMLTRNGTIDFPITGKKIEFKNKQHDYRA